MAGFVRRSPFPARVQAAPVFFSYTGRTFQLSGWALTLRLCPQVFARAIVRGRRALALPERSFDSPAP